LTSDEAAFKNSVAMIAKHIPRKVGPEVQRRIDALRVGQKMQDLPEELWHPSFRYYLKEDPNRKGGPNLRMIRLDPERPSLNAADYGAPQLRRRLFAVGFRSDAVRGAKFSFPMLTHSGEPSFCSEPYRTVGEAFDGLPATEERDSTAAAA
jgi:hypothetical protein